LGVKKVKKFIAILFLLMLNFSVAACSSESSTTSKDSKEKVSDNKENGKLLNNEEFVKMFSDPKKYKGSKVEFYAKVFVEPEKDEDGTYLQAFANNNSERNILIGIADPDLDVKVDDIIFVSGTVKDVFEGENALGGTVTAPVIKADKIEISDYATAFAPAIKTIDINKEQNQHGYILKLNKMDIAENETRLYVTVINNTQDQIYFYDFNSKLIVGNQQMEPTDNWDAGYPEIQSEILPGVTTEGIITYQKVPETGTIRVYMEGSSDNYDLNFSPFEFEITY
jgi:hypothetical protein